MELFDEYYKLKEELDGHLDDMQGLVVLTAQNDSKYRIELAKEVLRSHEECNAWTVCETLARGNTYVAQLKYELDVTDRMLKIKNERVMALKMYMKNLEAQIDREWNRSGGG